MASKIEWTDETYNPVIGCTKVSAGCDNCYAERMADRLRLIYEATGRNPQYIDKTDMGKWTGEVGCFEDLLDKPLHWRKPRRIFVNSMSDTFHPAVPFSFIDKIVDVAEKCPQHTLQLLTKRASIMYDYSKYREFKWPENIIGMVTAENQERADWCIPYLLQCGFKTTGVSIEPMLGPVDLTRLEIPGTSSDGFDNYKCSPLRVQEGKYRYADLGPLHWVIVGGESGPNARPMHPDWVRSIRDQCVAANVPFFFKQWGNWLPMGQNSFNVATMTNRRTKNGEPIYTCTDGNENKIGSGVTAQIYQRKGSGNKTVARVGKKKAGCLLDGKEWKQYPKEGEL